ncbi:MAG: acetyl-CoA acetyltransferase [Deltaproteobacteria bacterium]|nr:acetyl-CoA acetyltransferase [Deltaproteobacteria bacterium]
MLDERTPILVGAGQLTQRDVEPSAAKEPLAMMETAALEGARDAGLPGRTLAQLDHVAVANILAWSHSNAPGHLAQRLGARPRRLIYTTVGGNTPQWLVNETAEQIAAGRVRFALLAGAESVYTLARARRAHAALQWTTGEPADQIEATVIGSDQPGTNDYEMAHGLTVPTTIYPLFENALRAHYGLSLAEHRRRLGELCHGFSKVAAENPYAWFREERSAAEITTVTPQNRMIGFPYPKYMNAILDVDQSAAVLMTSVGAAKEMGIPPSKWVYLLGCGDVHDIWYVSERAHFYSSPAIRAAGRRALEQADLAIRDIDHLDLYSCFPSAVQIARDMLEIALDDPRPLTVTGGLPYHGGPGNNYVMHAIATMMRRLREQPGSKGLVTGLGWYVTKHSVGIYGTEPPQAPFSRRDPGLDQATIDQGPRAAVVEEANGRGTVETYTVLHDREGAPMRGIIVGRLDDGRRFLANTAGDRDVLEGLEGHEAIGRTGRVVSKDGSNRFEME